VIQSSCHRVVGEKAGCCCLRNIQLNLLVCYLHAEALPYTIETPYVGNIARPQLQESPMLIITSSWGFTQLYRTLNADLQPEHCV